MLVSGTGEAPALFEPGWAIVMVVGAVLLSVAIGKLARLPGLRGVRRWLLLARVLLWGVVLLEVIFTLSWAITDYWLVLAVLLVGVLSLAGLDWLRNVAAGLALAFERQLDVGDMVRYGDIEGKIAAFGARAVTLVAPDGTRHQVPNARVTREAVSNIQSRGESACEMTVRIPAGVDPDRAIDLVRQICLLTPLASPRRRPEVFWDSDPAADGPLRLHVRGFVFDPAYREHFKSDVLARIHRKLRAESTDAPETTVE